MFEITSGFNGYKLRNIMNRIESSTKGGKIKHNWYNSGLITDSV